MLTLSYAGHSVNLSPKSILIVKGATEEDYTALANEDLKIEFDGACLYIHSPATKRHERIIYRFLQQFEQYFLVHPLDGEAIGSHFALKLPNGKRPEPDIVIVPVNVVGEYDSVFEGVPILIVEILSPSTRDHDLEVKLPWYQEAHAPEIWLVDIDAMQIRLVYWNVETEGYEEKIINSQEIVSKILPRLTVNLGEVFQ